jgi:YebC/PmpR family DNA-binding regulatory protein
MGGGDPDANPRLRLAIDKARSSNMPKDNIQRAIQKGVGGGEDAAFEEVIYEGYGLGGAAVLLEALTDNRKRTVSEVRHVFTKNGGNLGSSGCVAYLFEKKGIVSVPLEGTDLDALIEVALDAGALDVLESEDSLEVVTTPSDCESVKTALVDASFAVSSAAVQMEPTTLVKLEGKDVESMLRLADALDDLDDIQAVYANFDISDQEMANFA